MITKLSAKGQLVIPKEIRQALDLKPGTEFEVELVEGRIVLQPLFDRAEIDKLIDEMRRLARNTHWLDDLEAEHRKEIERDRKRLRAQA